MAYQEAIGKDENLYLRTAGTPATSTETGTGKYIGVTGRPNRYRAEVTALGLSSPATETYSIKFQESDALAGTYTDIPGSSADITAVADVDVIFENTKDYVRHVITIGGSGSKSIDGNVIATQE